MRRGEVRITVDDVVTDLLERIFNATCNVIATRADKKLLEMKGGPEDEETGLGDRMLI